MTPIILVSPNEKQTSEFIENYVSENNVSLNYFFEIRPKLKEISIEQIRDLKKSVIYSNLNPQLYVIFNFDTASYEAQNALLKTLEEHSENIHFILVVSRHHHLAQTIISRSKIQVLKNENAFEDRRFDSELENFLKVGDLKMITTKDFQAKEYSNNLDVFDRFINFFRSKISKDEKATQMIRETLNLRSLVENNNVDPQNAVDYLLIQIANYYPKS